MQSNHFLPHELTCKCDRGNDCDAVPLEKDLLTKLNKLRAELGKKMIITSSERCAYHNDKIGGSENSYHLLGRAVDVKTDNAKHAGEIVVLAIKLDFRGIGVGKGFLHLDVRMSDLVVFGY